MLKCVTRRVILIFHQKMTSVNNIESALLLIKNLQTKVNDISYELSTVYNTLITIKAENEDNTKNAITKNISKREKFSKRNNVDELDNNTKKFCPELKFKFAEEYGYVVVYTDGACSKNGFRGAKAGIGVWWGDNHPLNVSRLTVSRHTNNTAEIQACIDACNTAHQQGIKKLLIKTDSDFVIKCMTVWISKWKQNNWKTATGKDVINKEDLVTLDKLSSMLTDVKYEHIRAHTGVYGNEQADKLAVQATTL